ncbi:hypothetical protein ACJX0J_017113, partial [Zea mays]
KNTTTSKQPLYDFGGKKISAIGRIILTMPIPCPSLQTDPSKYKIQGLIILFLDALLINVLAMGMGYSSLGVALFKLRKSMHTLSLPDSFFSNGTILETHSAYLQ